MSDRQTINVSVPPALDEFIRSQVASGRFRTSSEVVREGLRLLQEAEHRRLLEKWLSQGLTKAEEGGLPSGMLEQAKKSLRVSIDAGLAEVRAGQTVDGEEVMARLHKKIQARRKK
jgi:antitoxin ParD1/3/4